jgi:tetratricopeptide (TPR) repeat protein
MVLAGAGAYRMGGWSPSLPDPLATGFAAYARSDWTTAADLARRRLVVDRSDNRALLLLARSSVHLGRNQAASEQFHRLVSEGRRTLSAEDYYLLGQALHRQHQTADAIAAWEAGNKLEPERPELLDELARGYSEQNRLVEAASTAERLGKQPDWAVRAGLMLGELRFALNDPIGAVHALDGPLQDDSKLRAATTAPFLFRKLMARNLLRLGRPAPARSQLETVLDAGPDVEGSWLLSRAELQERKVAAAAAAVAPARSYRSLHPLEPEPGPYVGAERCAPCHRDIYKAVLSSRHAQSFYRGDQLQTLHLPDHPLEDPGDPEVTHAFQRTGDQLRIETRRRDRVYQCVIDYAFGTHDRYLTMVGRDEEGEYRAARLSFYHSPLGSGWDISAGDTPKTGGALGFLGRPIEARQGAVRCLYCHVTNVRGGTERSGPESADPGIGCERCHGPGQNHVRAVESQFPEMAIAASTLSPASSLARLCSECHTLHSPEVEAKVPRTDPIWHRSPGVSFTWSRCVTTSGDTFNCLTCHDPHRGVETSTSYYENKCLSCHRSSAPTKASTEANSPPTELVQAPSAATVCPVNSARGCLECHMPRVQNDLLHIPLTDHYIRVRTRPGP